MGASAEFGDDDLVNEIIEKATRDAQFRERLLRDPEETIQEEFGVKPAEGFEIRFIEKPDDVDALIVLPDLRPGDRLTDEELDQVAGGTSGGTKWQEDDG